MSGFADRLIDRGLLLRSHVIVGLDPSVEKFPRFLQDQLRAEPTESCLEETIFAFNRVVIEAVERHVVGFKPQAAFYEQYGLAGFKALQRTLILLRERDLLIIMDAKRNDVSHTAGAYATAWLAPHHPLFKTPNLLQSDALTVNGYLGSDGVWPFLEVNPQAGLFVLAKTSNPSSGELQDLPLAAGGSVAEKMAELAHAWGRVVIGEHGYSNIGLVVGATYPEVATRLRQLAPQALFLMPGIGVQGGALDAIAAAAGKDHVGAYAASSRGVLYPFQPDELSDSHWRSLAMQRIEQAAIDLKEAILNLVPFGQKR
ncbi:MAG: orotidine-5'-phosphate decarboxylase [Magnetococcus sp. DMHC-6]